MYYYSPTRLRLRNVNTALSTKLWMAETQVQSCLKMYVDVTTAMLLTLVRARVQEKALPSERAIAERLKWMKPDGF